jgi:peptidoglycan/LPS O-acetylase OafA/YrhL
MEITIMRLRSIDGLRGIAVLSVLCVHIFHWRMGARGVDLFFVISGFCLGLHALERGFDMWKFAGARARRILPPYYAAIAIGIIASVGDGRLPLSHALAEGARNVVFMSEWQPLPTLNGTFWTILLEVRWYVYFPALLWVYVRSKWAFGAIMAACMWGNYFSVPWIDREALPAFMLGIIAADMTLRGMRIPLFPFALGVPFALAIGTEIMRPAKYTLIEHGDFLWQISLALIVFESPRLLPLSWEPLAFVGRFSYSTYLCQSTGLELLSPYPLSPFLVLPIIVLWGFAFYSAFEKPFLQRSWGRHPEELKKRMQEIRS